MKRRFNSDVTKQIRKLEGLTQDEFARIIGVGLSSIKNYESGRGRPDNVSFRRIKKYVIEKGYDIQLFVD